MEISVGCKLAYTLAKPTFFILQIQPANADSQAVVSEKLLLPSNAESIGYDTYVDPISNTRKVRCLIGQGEVVITYQATVEVNAPAFDPAAVQEFAFPNIPFACIEYVAPSRYCPSDLFTDFAFKTFGGLTPGYGRVVAICDWIFHNIRYQSGSTGPASDATDVFKSGQGVCRDFAHLGISLCRALGIPARYASVYADQLVPQDFHAIFQAYLLGPNGGNWFSFDPTRMSSVDAVARIASGRDAADVAFAWPQGEVTFSAPEVFVEAKQRGHSDRTKLAVPA